MIAPDVFDGVVRAAWWPALEVLDAALRDGDQRAALRAHAHVAHGVASERAADLPEAVAAAVLFRESLWAEVVADVGPAPSGAPEHACPQGIEVAARFDLRALAGVVARDWEAEVAALTGSDDLPPWRALAVQGAQAAAGAARASLARALARRDADAAWLIVEGAARSLGAGPLARFEAFAWEGEGLRGIAEPAAAELARLVGLDGPIARLTENVEAFLADRPALPTLLYGPRGSGKSTAVRALLPRYRERGIRLVEVAGHRLDALPAVLDTLRKRPHHHVIFLDDLAFDDGDARVRPLKSLLEGSLRAGPPRVLVVATSNRRHLVRERFTDRPGAGDDDVHAWDTHHDRLALADRFGLVITFPGADERAYLRIVGALAEGLGLAADGLEERALRFAAWGNGYSGRTARQFVDLLRRDAVPSEPTRER